MCSVTVQSVVCGNILGEAAAPIAVSMNSNDTVLICTQSLQ